MTIAATAPASVMVTGHRPHLMSPAGACWAEHALDQTLTTLLGAGRVAEAVSGLALGADTWWALAALRHGVSLHACLPFDAQAAQWSPAERALWAWLRAAASSEQVAADTPSAAAYHARNDAMLDRSGLVVAVHDPALTAGGTASTVAKAHRRGLSVVLINPADQTITWPPAQPAPGTDAEPTR